MEFTITPGNTGYQCIHKCISTLTDSQEINQSTKTPNHDQLNDIYLQPSDGTLTRDPAYIDSAQIVGLGTSPPTYGLLIKGSLPTPCHQLRVNTPPPDQENRIMVEVYSVVDPSAVCIQMLKDFEAQVSMGNLSAGHYLVFVNGEKAGEIEVP